MDGEGTRRGVGSSEGSVRGEETGGAARKHKDEQHAESARTSEAKEDLLHDSKEEKKAEQKEKLARGRSEKRRPPSLLLELMSSSCRS